MALTLIPALWFLPFVVPICIYVAWSDMKYMKIPNKSVLALIAVFMVIGLIALPFEEYLWRYAHFAIVLTIGFFMSSARLVGAGDAKFAAAMAPFIARPDVMLILTMFAAVLLGALAAHKIARRIPMVRAATPDWISWTVENKKFPMGLALTGTLTFYLLLPVIT